MKKIGHFAVKRGLVRAVPLREAQRQGFFCKGDSAINFSFGVTGLSKVIESSGVDCRLRQIFSQSKTLFQVTASFLQVALLAGENTQDVMNLCQRKSIMGGFSQVQCLASQFQRFAVLFLTVGSQAPISIKFGAFVDRAFHTKHSQGGFVMTFGLLPLPTEL